MNRTRYYLSKYVLAATVAVAVSSLAAPGCNGGPNILQHKLVATGGAHSIPMYPDEPTFLKVAGRSQQGGISGAVGDLEKQFSAKQIDDQTAVEIISTDSNGAEVRISDGPMKGAVGFVASQNVG